MLADYHAAYKKTDLQKKKNSWNLFVIEMGRIMKRKKTVREKKAPKRRKQRGGYFGVNALIPSEKTLTSLKSSIEKSVRIFKDVLDKYKE